jgi:hypothetical protein
MNKIELGASEWQRLGEGYKNEIKNPGRERQTLEALMNELSGDK